MRTQIIITLFAVLLVSCAPVPTLAPIGTPTDILPTNTLQPTETFTPEPTATPVVSKIDGVLFFDMNASGLRDQALFVLSVDKGVNLPAIIQKLFPQITGKNGEVFTVNEPGLAGFSVCTEVSGKQYCDVTDENGKFAITSIPTAPGTKVFLKIKDPNAENIQLAMKYTNQWRKSVVVPAYEINGVKVPEQHLNDTRMVTLGSSIDVTTDSQSEIGLTQGYLTLPFAVNNMLNPVVIWNGYDVCGKGPYVRDEIVSNFMGITSAGNPYSNPPRGGQLDSHAGLDFAVPEGTLIVASLSGSVTTGIGEMDLASYS